MSEVGSKQVSEIRPDSDSRWKCLRVMAGAHQGWVRSCTVDPVTNKWFVTGTSRLYNKNMGFSESEFESYDNRAYNGSEVIGGFF